MIVAVPHRQRRTKHASSHSIAPIHIVIADDDKSNIFALKFILGDKFPHCTFHYCGNGDEAWSKLRSLHKSGTQVAVLVTDGHMEKEGADIQTGSDLIRTIQQSRIPGMKNIYTILATSDNKELHGPRGTQRVIHKPLDSKDIIEAVAQGIKTHLEWQYGKKIEPFGIC